MKKQVDLRSIAENSVLGIAKADVGRDREKVRRAKLFRLSILMFPVFVWLWSRMLQGETINPAWSWMPDIPATYVPAFALIVMLGISLLSPLFAGKHSPHVLYRPSEIDVSLADVKGADVVVEEIVKTLNLFLAHKSFKEQMGGNPRRGILFEGPPGTGKTYLAKAMAKEAGVPFLFVSSSAFQSMYYGSTNRKIRSYFKAMRKMARKEGGAIGFIEEIDAIGASRSGMGDSNQREGFAGVVNELLIQMQSFDTPPMSARFKGYWIDVVNRWLPLNWQLRKPQVAPANILVIAATNRAKDLDPALLRPGRFDRSIYFDLPTRSGRREIIDYYLDKKAHDPDLDDPARRDTLAAMTFGYSPVMIEHILDEALIWALRRGGDKLSWDDLQQAKMTEDIGLAQPVEYTIAERRTIATHESGHATVAHLVGASRKLEVLSIIKRKDALGLLAHSDLEERYTKSQSEIEQLIQIAMGGICAEELFFGETSSGVASDLQVATSAAAQMVGSFGMADSLISYEAMKVPGDIVAKVLSSEEGRDRVEKILTDARKEVSKMLEANRYIIEALRDTLLDRDELLGDEILEIINQAQADQTELPSTKPPKATSN